jgi:hypothetical protein
MFWWALGDPPLAVGAPYFFLVLLPLCTICRDRRRRVKRASAQGSHEPSAMTWLLGGLGSLFCSWCGNEDGVNDASLDPASCLTLLSLPIIQGLLTPQSSLSSRPCTWRPQLCLGVLPVRIDNVAGNQQPLLSRTQQINQNGCTDPQDGGHDLTYFTWNLRTSKPVRVVC